MIVLIPEIFCGTLASLSQTGCQNHVRNLEDDLTGSRNTLLFQRRIDSLQDPIGTVQPVARLASDLPQQAHLYQFLHIALCREIRHLQSDLHLAHADDRPGADHLPHRANMPG
jgi:hypothetical protein